MSAQPHRAALRYALLSLALGAWGVADIAAAEPPVKVTSVEPDSMLMNPNGRLIRQLHPARFRVGLENTSASTQQGLFASEVIGHLGVVYGLGRERVTLAAGEKKVVTACWLYPVDTTYNLPNGMTIKEAGASWGHEFRAAWMDSEGRILNRGTTVFAILQDGRPKESPEPAETEKLDAKAAFELRYSGYLRNPVYKNVTDASVTLEIGGKAAGSMTSGEAPSGLIAFLAKPGAITLSAPAVLTLKNPSQHLVHAWLLDPGRAGGPAARRLWHRVDNDRFLFNIPACSASATLVMELRGCDARRGDGSADDSRSGFPLAEMAARGDKQFGPYRSLLQDAEGKPVTTAAQWNERRAKLKDAVWKALGASPEPKATPFEPQILSEESVPTRAWPTDVTRGYTMRKVSIQARAGSRMNLWMLIPQGLGPFPAVVALHQTVQDGKDEPVGLGGHYHVLNFGPFLASRGYVVVAVDSLGAGERWDAEKSTSDIARLQKNPAWSLIGERLRDHIRAVDYLETLPFVDKNRIGAIGHSLGGESTAYLMAMDERIRAAVPSCGFTMLRTMKKEDDVYTPRVEAPAIMSNTAGLSKEFGKYLDAPIEKRKLPFDHDDIMSLWAPRAVYHHDVWEELWPNAPQVAQAAVKVQDIYKLLGMPEKYYVRYSRQAHCFPAWVQPDAYDWLDYWLRAD